MGAVVVHIWQSRIVTLATAHGATPAQAQTVARVLSQPGAKRVIAAQHPPAELIYQLKQALTTAISAAYYVAAGVLLVAAITALVVLRHVRAADEHEPSEPQQLSAPRTAGV
jgi:hypothetical protein